MWRKNGTQVFWFHTRLACRPTGSRCSFDAVTDYAIYLLDNEGVIRTWNSGAERIKGYRARDIIGQHFSLFFTAEDRANDVPGQILARASRAGRAEQEGWRVRKDGSRFWAASIVQPVRDSRGRAVGFAKITRDITERQQAQQALYESERKFRLLVEAVKDCAIYMLDPSGIIVNWNSGAERLKGYSAAEIVGQHFSKFYTRDDRMAGLPARVLEAAARDGHYEAEGWRLRKDGGRLLGRGGGRRHPRRESAIDRLRQNHPRHYRASNRAADFARNRAAVPHADRGRHRLRSLHARSQRSGH